LDDAIPDGEKSRRLAILLERQRAIQQNLNKKHLGENLEVMVEAKNEARGQWVGRTTQNKTLNFTAGRELELGSYAPVRVTTAFPNSLVGELTESEVGVIRGGHSLKLRR
jgi:tRNA-2-methylthio-N6-dimethylallyladenosine synthase